ISGNRTCFPSHYYHAVAFFVPTSPFHFENQKFTPTDVHGKLPASSTPATRNTGRTASREYVDIGTPIQVCLSLPLTILIVPLNSHLRKLNDEDGPSCPNLPPPGTITHSGSTTPLRLLSLTPNLRCSRPRDAEILEKMQKRYQSYSLNY
ncbi:hypothetical protein B0H16DRAFT_1568624, partial [Mycena metata]